MYDMVRVHGDEFRSRLCAREFEAEQQRDDIFSAGPPDTFHMTRQENDSFESRYNQEKTTKCLHPVLLEKNKHKRRRTALCSAVLALRGTDIMPSKMAWSVPGHQR